VARYNRGSLSHISLYCFCKYVVQKNNLLDQYLSKEQGGGDITPPPCFSITLLGHLEAEPFKSNPGPRPYHRALFSSKTPKKQSKA
jgi:hypothetical protein